ncbi:MAG: tetratricopeptide repeat protein, partial [Nitrososphaeraceae archaeon]
MSIFFLGYSYTETSEVILSIKNINNTIGTNSTMSIDEDIVFNDTIKNALSSFNSNNYENAIIWYNKAITINPLSIEAINGKGLSLSESGKHQEAIELYDRAVKRDPNSKQVLNNKGYSVDEGGK